MRVLDQKFAQDLIHMAHDGWLQGWHEHNGGNFSYRLKHKEVKAIQTKLHPGAWHTLELSAPELAEQHFMITAAGSQFRQISRYPKECLGIIELDCSGKAYRICWGFKGGTHPTSELPMHLQAQKTRSLATKGDTRVLYHAHPTNVVALTAILPLESATITRALWSALCECALILPDGVGVIGWEVPGTPHIAHASAAALADHSTVIWAHHGVFCSGPNADIAFGRMHTIEKAASVLMKVYSTKNDTTETRQKTDLGITRANIEALAQTYGLTLNQAALERMN